LEERKVREREFHNTSRTDFPESGQVDESALSRKFYTIIRRSRTFVEQWLLTRCNPNTRLLDFGCGAGHWARHAAKINARAIGIDISDVAIRAARKEGEREGLGGRASFLVMDCESLGFTDNSFDVILVSGLLHHLDLKPAYGELSRVVSPNGQVICIEALGHNPVIRMYRHMTPHLRTLWERDHILRKADLALARHYFGRVECRFFHLTSLMAVPFRHWKPVFNVVLTLTEFVDDILLRLPWVKWQAWQVVFILAEPKKALLEGTPTSR
jgi:ubiquinone/menaquinone biosynthesis C-methylase UbiE